MAYQKVFKRYELKFMLTADQKKTILKAMEPYMVIDEYGRSTIRNIYFDTEDSILARHSIMKPDFKEKLRIRSYCRADEKSMVFVELKRKFDHVVYKRRIGLPEKDAMSWICGHSRGANAFYGKDTNDDSDRQVRSEINYFLDYYRGLEPAMFISYDREAYRLKKPDQLTPDQRAETGCDGGFRITFDSNILCRDHDMSLTSGVYGKRLIPEGAVLMEVKCTGGIPLWLVKILSEERIYKTSFSKYGTAYSIRPGRLAAGVKRAA